MIKHVPYPTPMLEMQPESPQPLQWSIMMPSFNSAATIVGSLESVLHDLGNSSDVQIEVIDNHSTDRTVELVRAMGDDRISVVVKEANTGMIDNWNECIRRAAGRLVHILHADDLVHPGFYARIERLAEEHPDLGLFTCRSLVVDQQQVAVSISPNLAHLKSGDLADEFMYYCPVYTPAMVVRRSVYKKVGGFLADLRFSTDWEMWYRILRTHGGIAVPEVLVSYREHAANATSGLFARGEALWELKKTGGYLSAWKPGWSASYHRQQLCEFALGLMAQAKARGDHIQYRHLNRFWIRNALLRQWPRRLLIALAWRLFPLRKN